MIKQATPQQSHEQLSERDDAVLVDVRTEAEFLAGHPTAAVNIPILVATPMGQMQPNRSFVAQVSALYAKDVPIYCSCKMGGRSQQAAMVLAQAGFTNVTNVIGGWSGGPNPETGEMVPGWQPSGLPSDTSDDHAFTAIVARIDASAD